MVVAQCTGAVVAEVVVYLAFVLLGLYAISVASQSVPFFGISDAPPDAKINRVGLSLQSLRHILFESDLASIYRPSPPPPPPRPSL